MTTTGEHYVSVRSEDLASANKAPPLILIDDHPPYPQAILQVFGQIKHRRRRHGRGRRKHPRLKPPLDLQVGVVNKIRDSRGNLLKVSSKVLFGKKEGDRKAYSKAGHRPQDQYLSFGTPQWHDKGTTSSPDKTYSRWLPSGADAAIFDMDVARFVQLDQGTLLVVGPNPCDGVGVDRRGLECFEIYSVSGSCQRPSTSRLGRAA